MSGPDLVTDGRPRPRRRAAARRAPRAARCAPRPAGAPPRGGPRPAVRTPAGSEGSSAIRRSTSASTSSAASPRATARSWRAWTSCRMSASRSATAARAVGDRDLAGASAPPSPFRPGRAAPKSRTHRRKARPRQGATTSTMIQITVPKSTPQVSQRHAAADGGVRYDIDSPIGFWPSNPPPTLSPPSDKETFTWLTSRLPTSRKTCASWRTTSPRRRSARSRGTTTGMPCLAAGDHREGARGRPDEHGGAGGVRRRRPAQPRGLSDRGGVRLGLLRASAPR